MSLAFAQKPFHMSLPEFLGFLDSRPEEERWQLIAGVPIMMSSPTIAHQRIASNLERYLNETLERVKPEWRADREIGLILDEFGEYRPEPDLTVVDVDFDARQRHVDRFYVVVEVVSDSDEARFARTEQSVLEAKMRFYKDHAQNRAVVVIRQDKISVELHLRDAAGAWPSEPEVLNAADDMLILPGVGPICRLSQLYKGTSLVKQ